MPNFDVKQDLDIKVESGGRRSISDDGIQMEDGCELSHRDGSKGPGTSRPAC